MRAWEFTVEVRRAPGLTLRQLNQMKLDHKARQASQARHDALVQIMYRNPSKDLERIELEKAYIELIT